VAGREVAVVADELVESLIGDLLEWLAKEERPYDVVMSAWRTSCPKLPVWEDANDRGLVVTEVVEGRQVVRLTARGRLRRISRSGGGCQ
jgi:D-3-phosphoglycerate dehydrogenase